VRCPNKDLRDRDLPILEPLKPFFEGMIATSGRRDDRPAHEARETLHAMIEESFNAFAEPQGSLPLERDYKIAVSAGSIAVRQYSPVARPDDLPCYLYFHGGGFWLGTLDQADANCRAIAKDANCVVVSVDYRLAPEHKFPTAAEDCFAALLWVSEHAGELGVDSSRLAVGGGSAGGNLAAVVALIARERGGPALSFQVLEIPVTDFTHLEPLQVPGEALTVPSGKEQYRSHYLSSEADATNPHASPLLAANHARLPPALVMCAEYDPLMPEGKAYADRLREAGVPVEYRCWEGQFHGSQGMTKLIPVEAAAYRAQLVGSLRNAWEKGDK
jgi:acetyl esterase